MLRLSGLLLLSALVSASGLAAEDHGIGKIVTEELDLSYIDHVLTGRVGDRPVFARPLDHEFGITLWHRAQGEDFETVFKKNGERFTGPVLSRRGAEDRVSASFEITAVHAEDGIVKGLVGDRDFTLTISSETMDGHHYVNPLFTIVFADGANYSFDLKDGQACIGCAIKLSYAIISMLYAYGTI